MRIIKKLIKKRLVFSFLIIMTCCAVSALLAPQNATAGDLPQVQQAGVLRHLGVPYANFVTGSGDGLDVELIKLFARHLGVRYEYVKTDWQNVIPDLTGKQVTVEKGQVHVTGETPVKGDLAANGMTILPWRSTIIDFSSPTFPTQVWLLARADSPMQPIVPTGDINQDIVLVKKTLQGHPTIGKQQTCLDPELYNLKQCASSVLLFDGALNELAPAVLNGMAESTILDVPDALIALEKWPGKLKVIGPISPEQQMGVGFAKTSPLLRQAFEKFFAEIKADGTYHRLVNKYYLSVFSFYPNFFENQQIKDLKKVHRTAEGG